jgi:hypothetical protein
MSSALALSGVTIVLKTMLSDVYTSTALGSVKVSAVAPDIVQAAVGTSSDAQLQVNLFLHQVTPNAAWRNMGLPSLAADGATRLKNPPLALDLHYMLTVYAGGDAEAEALLGYAVLMLFQNPVLTRNTIRNVLAGLPAGDPVAASGLADQVEMINLTPATLGREEMAWIWTALKADYRPTFSFLASVVLIQSPMPASSALPVLSRSIVIQPSMASPYPALTAVAPPNSQPAASLGDTVTVSGTSLTGATEVVLTNSQLGIEQTIPVVAGSVGNASLQFAIPNPSLPSPQPNPTDLPVGVYLLSAQVGAGLNVQTTNGLPLVIAPAITSLPAGPLTSGPSVTLSVSCAPYVRTSQQVSFLIGSQEAVADPFTEPTNSPSFTFVNLQSTGQPLPVRLRVDGIDSPTINMLATPPAFSGPFLQVS